MTGMSKLRRAGGLLYTVVMVLMMLASPSQADLYMHSMRGSNNRLNEQSRDRANANRLFDSQNNARGGYNKPSTGLPYYYSGSVLPIEWTAQHACADPTDNCQFVIQYTCDANIRDGTTTTTIPTNNNQCANNNCDTDPQYGRQESLTYYNTCRKTLANRGLFNADQNLQNNGNAVAATATRTNPNNQRFGYECAEERDYYPYWNPSPWKDVAIITSEPARCAALQAESQNVKSRYTCVLNNPTAAQQATLNANQAILPITQAACTAIGGTWTLTSAFNIAAPECLAAASSRDNHLGNVAGTRYTYVYNWTLPADFNEACAFRMRYNISTSDFSISTLAKSSDPLNAAFKTSTSAQAGIDSTYNVANGQNTLFPMWTKYNLTYGAPDYGVVTAANENTQYSRGYHYDGDPIVDPFGPLVWANGVKPAAASAVRLRLAINTQQFFRIFQDRSHTFAIRQRPAALASATIYNLSVRGKSGNIVQVFPAVEYDFLPDRLIVKQGDFIHFQWAGSNTNPDAPNVDYSNVILQGNRVYAETNVTANPAIAYTYGQLGRAYPCRIDNPTTCPFLGLGFMDLQRLALNGLNSTYFDLGPRQVTKTGIYNYMSTRNNNFSNRNQQATIVVRSSTYSAVAFGPEAATSGVTAAASTNAWVDQGQFSGKLVVSQFVYVDDAGASEYASNWFHVTPNELTIADGEQVVLHLPYQTSMLSDAVVLYKPDATAQDLTEVPVESTSDGIADVSITKGGYYVVRTEVNKTYVAGILLAVVGVLVLCTGLYWKVRVQPLGGWKAWLRSGKESHAGAEAVNAAKVQASHDPIERQKFMQMQQQQSPRSNVQTPRSNVQTPRSGNFAHA